MRSPRHGTENEYRRYNCRCEECVTAFRRIARERRARARQKPTPDYAHGTVSGYTYWGCRCGLCAAEYRRVQTPRAKVYRETHRDHIAEQRKDYWRRRKEQEQAAEAARRARLLKRGA